MIVEAKITEDVKLQYEEKQLGYITMLYGKLKVHNDEIEFQWNLSADTRPVLRNRKYDRTTVEDLANLINHYQKVAR
jgi:hypothetical protein